MTLIWSNPRPYRARRLGLSCDRDANLILTGAGARAFAHDAPMTETASYSSLQSQLKKSFKQGVQGVQLSYTYGHCADLSSAPVTGDTFLNSIAVPLLLQKFYPHRFLRLRCSA